jgi:hypothetical protein
LNVFNLGRTVRLNAFKEVRVTLFDASSLVYLALAVPVVSASTWSMYRHGALPLLDLLEADEMLTAALNRLLAVGYAFVALGLAAALAPRAHDVRAGLGPAVLNAMAGLLLLLGMLHLGLLALFGRLRHRRSQRNLAPSVWVPPMPVLPPVWVPPVPPVGMSLPPMPVSAYGPGAASVPFDPWTPPVR